MSKQNSLSKWLKLASADVLNAPKRPTTQKRKRSEPNAPVNESDVEDETKPKKSKPTKKAASTKPTPAQKAPAKKALEGKKAAEQLYKKIIGDVDKKVSSLDARVKKQGPNSAAVTSDHYAGAMVKVTKDLEKLKGMGPDGARCAFNAMLYIGPHAHGDLEASFKMSGYGGTEEPFAELDETILEIIRLRDDFECIGKDEGVDLPQVRHRWTIKDAEVGVFKTGRPNKQQRGQIEGQKAKWIKERFEEARKRREKVGDWVGNAIQELKEEATDIERYGLEGYFKKSVAKLEELRGDSVS